MKFLKWFFKEKEELQEEIIKNPCQYCKQEILSHERTKKFLSKNFHLKCARRAKRELLKNKKLLIKEYKL